MKIINIFCFTGHSGSGRTEYIDGILKDKKFVSKYELEKLDGRVDSIPVEKILDMMGVPKNYMDIVNM